MIPWSRENLPRHTGGLDMVIDSVGGRDGGGTEVIGGSETRGVLIYTLYIFNVAQNRQEIFIPGAQALQ